MKLLTLIALSVVVASCGRGGQGSQDPISAPVETTPAPSVQAEIPGRVVIDQPATQGSEPEAPVVAPIATTPVAPAPVVPTPLPVQPTYVIGGDANAARLLYSAAGIVTGAASTTDLVPGNRTNVFGYASPTVSMGYWNAVNMATPLLNILAQKCSTNTYFVWYQGDAEPWKDAYGSPVYFVYNNQLNLFLNKVRNACHDVKILMIPITNNSNNGPYLNQVLLNQQNYNTGVIKVQASIYSSFVNTPSPQGYWLNRNGLAMLWNDLTNQYR
jgi:hypothetical protein